MPLAVMASTLLVASSVQAVVFDFEGLALGSVTDFSSQGFDFSFTTDAGTEASIAADGNPGQALQAFFPEFQQVQLSVSATDGGSFTLHSFDFWRNHADATLHLGVAYAQGGSYPNTRYRGEVNSWYSASGGFLNLTAVDPISRADFIFEKDDVAGLPTGAEYTTRLDNLELQLSPYDQVIQVTNTNDSGAGSLREAIGLANEGTGTTQIVFDSSLAGQTITWTDDPPIISNGVTIDGSDAAGLTISGGNSHRVIFVDAAGSDVVIQDLTIADGLADGGDGGFGYSGGGGGLGAGGGLFVNQGAVTVERVEFANNAAIGGQGGESKLANNNSAGGGGGGLHGDAGSILDIGDQFGGSGGGGFYGAGGTVGGINSGAYGGSGGGGFGGDGGSVDVSSGSGGGGLALNGADGSDLPGAGAADGGGDGGAVGQAGANGATYGGGGGGGEGYVTGGSVGGGDGGRFGGGGGSGDLGSTGGAGGEMGGGGGGGQQASGGNGGFAGGGGAAGKNGSLGGDGGFGAGSGGGKTSAGAATYGGSGGASNSGGSGGGGAALGGAIFVRGSNGASLTLVDSQESGSAVTGGSAGTNTTGGAGSDGQALGSGLFLLGADLNLSVSDGLTQTLAGDIAQSDFNEDGSSGIADSGLNKSGAGTLILSGDNSYAGDTRIQAGTLQIGDGGSSGSVSGAIVNDATLVVNRADASGLGTVSGSGELIKQGAGTLTIDSALYGGDTDLQAGSLVLGSASALGGFLAVSSGASLDVTSGADLSAASTDFDALDDGRVEFSNTLQLAGVQISDTRNLTGTELANISYDRLDITTAGDVRLLGDYSQATAVANAGITRLLGANMSVDSFSNAAGATLQGNGKLITTGGGQQAISNAGTVQLSDSTLIGDVANSGLMQLTSSSVTQLLDDVVNDGQIQFGGVGSNTVAGSYANNGSTEILSGSSVSFFGDYSGNGTDGAGDVFFFGNVMTGFSPAAVTFGGDVTFSELTGVEIEIGGYELGEYDLMEIAGTATLDGLLDVVYWDGFGARPGDEWLIIDAAALSGSFADVRFADGQDWYVRYDLDAGDVYVGMGEVPVPSTLLLCLTALGWLRHRSLGDRQSKSSQSSQ